MSPSTYRIILIYLHYFRTAYYIITIYHIVFSIELLLDPDVLARNNLLIIIRIG